MQPMQSHGITKKEEGHPVDARATAEPSFGKANMSQQETNRCGGTAMQLK